MVLKSWHCASQLSWLSQHLKRPELIWNSQIRIVGTVKSESSFRELIWVYLDYWVPSKGECTYASWVLAHVQIMIIILHSLLILVKNTWPLEQLLDPRMILHNLCWALSLSVYFQVLESCIFGWRLFHRKCTKTEASVRCSGYSDEKDTFETI